AEDGIRDWSVTGVQTCALPISVAGVPVTRSVLRRTGGVGFARTEEAIDLLRACRLVRSHGPNEDDGIDTHHDRVREIVVQHLDEIGRAWCRERGQSAGGDGPGE